MPSPVAPATAPGPPPTRRAQPTPTYSQATAGLPALPPTQPVYPPNVGASPTTPKDTTDWMVGRPNCQSQVAARGAPRPLPRPTRRVALRPTDEGRRESRRAAQAGRDRVDIRPVA